MLPPTIYHTFDQTPTRYRVQIGGKLLLVALSGGGGTLARFSLTLLFERQSSGRFAWPTILVNPIGCFLAGLVVELAQRRWQWDPHTAQVVLIGFFGAFTTFSAIILETLRLGQGESWLAAGGFIMLQNALGLAAVFTGVGLARTLT